jgi:hypothetical protein
MNIIDEILYLSKRYRDTYNQSPTVLLMNMDTYNKLCDELNKDEVTNIHGLTIEITNSVIIDIQY